MLESRRITGQAPSLAAAWTAGCHLNDIVYLNACEEMAAQVGEPCVPRNEGVEQRTSSAKVFFSVWMTRSTTDTLGVGTRRAMPAHQCSVSVQRRHCDPAVRWMPAMTQ